MSENKLMAMGRTNLRKALIRADSSLQEAIIRFLEEDPKTFSSGYAKEIIWKYIKRYPLTINDVTRLEQAALEYLKRPMSREFKLMSQTMARIASRDFWTAVKAELNSDTPWTQINAYCLFAYSEGIQSGESLRLELNRIKITYYWTPRELPHDVFSVDDLLEKVKLAENWPGGQIVYQAANPIHLPILYYYSARDLEFAKLAVKEGNKGRILEKLKLILGKGTMNIFTVGAWVYAIYLLNQIDDEGAVPILIRFLEDKIDYKFGGPTKSLLESTSLKVLRKYYTVEAQQALKKRSAAERRYSEYYRDRSLGWSFSYPSIDD